MKLAELRKGAIGSNDSQRSAVQKTQKVMLTLEYKLERVSYDAEFFYFLFFCFVELFIDPIGLHSLQRAGDQKLPPEGGAADSSDGTSSFSTIAQQTE